MILCRSSNFLAIVLAVGACQHLSPVISDIPTEVRPYFSNHCAHDGALTFTVRRNRALAFGAGLDWIAENNGRLQAEVSDPFGGTLVGIDMTRQTISKYGSKKRVLDPLNLVRGRLYWGKYFLGLEQAELACLLAFKLPNWWQLNLDRIRTQDESTLIDIALEKRRVQISVSRNHQHTEICSRISWPVYWGLWSRELEWCFHETPEIGKHMTVRTPLDLSIMMVPADA